MGSWKAFWSSCYSLESPTFDAKNHHNDAVQSKNLLCFSSVHAVSWALFKGLLNFTGPTLIKPLLGEVEPKKTWLITVNL